MYQVGDKTPGGKKSVLPGDLRAQCSHVYLPWKMLEGRYLCGAEWGGVVQGDQETLQGWWGRGAAGERGDSVSRIVGGGGGALRP